MDDRVYLVGRSRIPEINVSTVAAYFGGGGHATAASASIKDLTLFQVENKLLEFLRSYIHPYPTAESMMTSPVIFTEPEVTVAEAGQSMIRYNINSMPVMEDGRIVGLTTRQVLEKAIFHGLEKRAVREFMTTDFSTVGPNATLLEIESYLVERHQRIVPVMEDNRVIGVITRRDLLKFLVEDQTTNARSLYGDTNLAAWSKRKNVVTVIM